MSTADRSDVRRLVVVRHGRTAWNHESRIQGQQDVGLDETGHAQAAAAAPYLAAYRPTRLVTSDLARARETAAYLGRAAGLDPVPDPRLREAMLGEREAMTHEEYARVAPEEFARFRAGDWDVVPGGEGLTAMRTRVVASLTELLDGTAAGATSMAVSHGGAIKVGTAALLGCAPAAVRSFRALRNCHWLVLERTDHGDRTGTPVLAAYGLTPISSSDRL